MRSLTLIAALALSTAALVACDKNPSADSVPPPAPTTTTPPPPATTSPMAPDAAASGPASGAMEPSKPAS